MAGKITAPSPAIFTSDPLEQIMGRGVLDRDMSGLAYMFLNAFGQRREMDQGTYMKGVSESNQQAQQIAEMEARNKQQEEFLKAAIKMAEMGQNPTSMPVMSNVIQAGNPDEATSLFRALQQSKIAANNRDPNAANNSVKVSADVGPAGSGFYNFKGPQNAVNQAIIEHMRTNPTPKQAPLIEAEKMRARRQYPGANIPE